MTKKSNLARLLAIGGAAAVVALFAAASSQALTLESLARHDRLIGAPSEFSYGSLAISAEALHLTASPVAARMERFDRLTELVGGLRTEDSRASQSGDFSAVSPSARGASLPGERFGTNKIEDFVAVSISPSSTNRDAERVSGNKAEYRTVGGTATDSLAPEAPNLVGPIANAIPEPSTWAFVGLGAALLALALGRRATRA